MAGRSVLYNIKSKDDTRGGISSAMQNLKGFDNRLKSVSGAMKGLLKYGAIAGAAAGVARAVGQISEAYRVQEKSEIQLAQSVRNNPLLNGKSFSALKAYSSELQAQSTYGDELLNAQAAQLAAQGKTEEQIKSILAASVDLASAGVMPLESAVKNLAKTYGGTAGELAESIPALKDLTKEQLANGEAVALVAAQYKGMGASVAASREGIRTQVSNLMGDIKESLGEIWTNVTGDFNSKLLPVINKINTWLSENKERIINFFRYIPQISVSTFNLIKGMLGKVFSPEFWKVFGSIAWDWFKAQAQITFRMLGGFVSAIATTIWEPLKWGFNGLIYGIKTIFFGMVNFFIDKINFLAEKAHDLGQKIAHPINASRRTAFSGGVERMGQNLQGPGAFPVNAIGEAWKEAAGTYAEALGDQFTLLKDSWGEVTSGAAEVFGDKLDIFLDEVNEKLTTPVVTALEQASSIGPETQVGGVSPESFAPILGEASGGLGEIFGKMSSSLGPVISTVVKFGSQLGSVMALMNPLQTIVSGIFGVLGPVIDQMLTPLVGILKILGQTIGQMLLPATQLLAPIINIISKAFVWLYNKVIVPVGNGIMKVWITVGNFFIDIINGVIGALNKIPFVDIDKVNRLTYTQLQTIDNSDLTNAGSSAISGSGGGGGATYSGGKNITNNWYINIGAFTADQDTFQEFVRFITLEQKRMERLGIA